MTILKRKEWKDFFNDFPVHRLCLISYYDVNPYFNGQTMLKFAFFDKCKLVRNENVMSLNEGLAVLAHYNCQLLQIQNTASQWATNCDHLMSRYIFHKTAIITLHYKSMHSHTCHHKSCVFDKKKAHLPMFVVSNWTEGISCKRMWPGFVSPKHLLMQQNTSAIVFKSAKFSLQNYKYPFNSPVHRRLLTFHLHFNERLEFPDSEINRKLSYRGTLQLWDLALEFDISL
jgi:hypothetical protein